MKLELWFVGKTSFSYLEEGISIYEKRLKHYVPFKIEVLPDLKNTKNLSSKQIKEKEGDTILKKLQANDHLIVLDENGKHFNSVEFAQYLENRLQITAKRLILLIGGAYGFSDAVYQRANGKLALSKMTFSHQMVRLFAIEQIYRGMTILRNEPYHHI